VAGLTPAFPFGHGLSFTEFAYADLRLVADGSSARRAEPSDWAEPRAAQVAHNVSFVLTNTGARDGVAVPQLYLGFPPASGEPPKVLRHFTKLALRPGEQRTVTFVMRPHDLQIWDVSSHGWSTPQGEFTLLVGASSADIRLQAPLQR